jgi:MinD-like ATPase involved in chromosome partitioning or flagellar assembly
MAQTVNVDYDLVANGDHISIGDAIFTGGTAYPDAMGWLAAQAGAQGAPAVVRSHDAGTGADTLFSIDGTGAIAPVTGTITGGTPAAPVAVAPVAREAAVSGGQVSGEAPAGAAPSTRREARQSFLTREEVEEPATQGFRGALTRIGIRVSPSSAERAERESARLVSQHWPGPRTIVVVNGKGGVGKTMTTISLSSVFARYGGAGVLAWDNNQTRGTLGWSTEQGPHDASILDLLPQVDRLLGTGAQSADLAHYVHHQTRDRYDVLRSKPEVLATEQRFDANTVDSIHAVAAKFYRLVFIDSGNDETDPMWVRALERADQIVVPTIGEAKAAESAALLLEGLHERGGHFAGLADRAVVIVSKHKHDLPDAELTRMAGSFRGLAGDVVTIPYDPALGADVLNHGALRTGTQRAWLAAGAAVAKGL